MSEKVSIREEMRIKEKKFAEERKFEAEKAEKILEKRHEFQKAFESAIRERIISVDKKYKGTFFTKNNRPDKKDFEEINSGEIMTETAGYIPLSEQIRRFERSGMNLKEEMEKIYDFGTTDLDKNGFSDRLTAQYSDKIDSFINIQEIQIKA